LWSLYEHQFSSLWPCEHQSWIIWPLWPTAVMRIIHDVLPCLKLFCMLTTIWQPKRIDLNVNLAHHDRAMIISEHQLLIICDHCDHIHENFAVCTLHTTATWEIGGIRQQSLSDTNLFFELDCLQKQYLNYGIESWWAVSWVCSMWWIRYVNDMMLAHYSPLQSLFKEHNNNQTIAKKWIGGDIFTWYSSSKEN
jgi:hypothetical protein